jgi:hypothetical protein
MVKPVKESDGSRKPNWRIIKKRVVDDKVWELHSTKGWRCRKDPDQV